MPGRLLVQEAYYPLKRKESTKFRLPIIVYVPFVAFYLIYGSKPYEAPLIGQYFPTPTITPLTVVPTRTSAYDFLLPSGSFTRTPSPTPWHLFPEIISPTAVSDIPVGFPFIRDQGSWYMSGQRVQFSYYYPPLGGVNCHEDNWVNGKCKNVTASGQGWQEYMGKGVAVHPDMLDLLPFGSLVYVVYPVQIRGYYTVIDLCGGCLIDGRYYFDFLFPSMPEGLNWSVDVDFLPVRIAWDGKFPPTRTPVPLSSFTPTGTQTPIYIVITAVPTDTPIPTQTVTSVPSFTSTPEIASPTATGTP